MSRRSLLALVKGRPVAFAVSWMMAVPLILVLVSSAQAASQSQIDASRNRGLAWLITHQHGDGSWKSTPGTEDVATTVALQALINGTVRGYPYLAGLAWLGSAQTPSVDSLARKTIILRQAGLDVAMQLRTLLAWRNDSQGAWGAYDHYEGSFPDTPLALAAIRIAQWSYSQTDYANALCYIVLSQKDDDPTVLGSWSYVHTEKTNTARPISTKVGAILPTARNLLELNAQSIDNGFSAVTCNGTSYTFSTVINNGITWLTTQRRNNSDGGFYEPTGGAVVSTVFETALAYEVLRNIDPTNVATTPALDYLLGQQRPDGSWNGDALRTAYVLKALPPPTTALLDSDGDGIPDAIEALLGTNPTVPDGRGLAPGNGLYTLTSLTPSRAPEGGAAFTLTVSGSGFGLTSVVQWNGVSRSTTPVSDTQLQATISSADIARAGTAQVAVFTPAPGGGTTNALPFTVTAFPVLTLANAGPASGTVTSNPAGILCGATCTAPFAPNTTVTLTATPAAGATFSGWSGACSGMGTCTVTPTNADVAVTATFSTLPYALTLVRNGTGAGTVTSAPWGIACGGTCIGAFPTGAQITLTATPAPGSSFAGWGAPCSGTGTCTLTLNASTTLTATFTAQQYALAVSTSGTGTGTITSSPSGIACGAACTGLFAASTEVTLNALPDAGSVLAGWGGDAACSTGVVTMAAAYTCTATFVVLDLVLDNGEPGTSYYGTWAPSTAPNPYGPTSLESRSADAQYEWYPTVPVTGSYQLYVWWTAAPTRSTTVPIYVFPDGQNGWEYFANQQSGGGQWQPVGTFDFTAGTAGVVAVTAEYGEASADAIRLIPAGAPALTITTVGAGTVTSLPAGIACGSVCTYAFPPGTRVALEATPDPGSVFAGWSGEGDCADGVVTLTAARACTATFTSNDLIVDNGQPGTTMTGTWTVSPASSPYGLDSMVSTGGGTYRWRPTLPTAGMYQVYVWWTEAATRSATVPITVAYAGDSQVFQVSQQQGGGQWHLLGTFAFDAGTSGYVEVSSANGEACADAVRFLPQ